MNQNRIRVALQKDGRLKKLSQEFLRQCGLKFSEINSRTMIVPCANDDVDLLYVRHHDIPEYVKNGAADFGIVGKNVLIEGGYNLKNLTESNLGNCKLIIAVPKDSPIEKISDLEGERIATSYPNSLKKFLKENNLSVSIIEIGGAVEIAPALGLADAICDITQTGTTLKENGLRIIVDIFSSNAVIIQSNNCKNEKEAFVSRYFSKII